MYDGPERRQRKRFFASGVDVLVKKRGWRHWFSKPERMDAIDFNAYGIGFESHQYFAPGDRVGLCIRIESQDIISITGIIRHVTSIGKEGRYRVGAQLDVLGIRKDDKERLNALLSRSNIDLRGV